MQDQHDSDFLTWTLAAVAVLIMTVAVRINATEGGAPAPAVHDPGELDSQPQSADHPREHTPIPV